MFQEQAAEFQRVLLLRLNRNRTFSFPEKVFLRFSKRNGVGKMRMAFFKIGLTFFKTFSCADFSVVVVNKTFLGHSKKSSKVSPQISR